MKYIIYDTFDGTSYAGEGDWYGSMQLAKRYDNAEAAAADLEDVDQDGLLLDRLVIRRVEE